VTKIYALEPASESFSKAADTIAKSDIEVIHIADSAEHISLPDESVDHVVSMWTMCTIPHPEKALREIYRVLKAGGTFVFVEHGQSPRRFTRMCQNIGTPLSKKLGGGCHLNRDIGALLKDTDFMIEHTHESAPKLRPLLYLYRGVARKMN
jgi:ubiquinone/menaquinone biosynthesis C-methylase UbiE